MSYKHVGFGSSAIHNSQLAEPDQVPSTDEEMKERWQITQDCVYSAIKRSDVGSFSSKRTELENILLSEICRLRRSRGKCFLSYEEARVKFKKRWGVDLN